MINSISSTHIAQNISMVNRNNNVSSKTTEEANESASERTAESSSQNSKIISDHTIDSYA